jgi:hypothetical protein
VAKKEWAEDADERDRAMSTRANIQTRNLEVQENLSREYVLKSQKKRESATVKNLENKINMLEKHKAIYVKKYGKDGYETKHGQLVDELLVAGAEEEKSLSSPTKERNNDVGSGGGNAAV